jgi:arylsulfatase
VVLALLCSLGPSARAATKPNIIYFLADDLGYAELGCYGQKIIRTPNLDRMAAEGIRFTQHYSGQAVCAPARCVLMTGKHTGHCSIRNNRRVEPEGNWPLPDEDVTIAELLKLEGYATAVIGKWGLGMVGNTGDPNKQGFDLAYGFYCQRHAHNHYPRYLRRNQDKVMLEGNDRTLTGKQYSQDLFTTEALQFIRDNKNRPFFLYMPFAIPHLSIQVPEESLAWYKGKIPEEEYKHKGYLKHPFPRAGYAAMITHMDRDIGRIMALVKELGLDDNTLTIFSSDNGPTYDRLGGSDSEFFESAGIFRGLKGSLYEGGIRVPMIARWPGRIEPGQTSDHVSAFWDVLPTLCDVVHIQPPSDIDGISFAPTLLGQGEQKRHEYLYWEFAAYGGQQVVRLGDWKGVRQNLMPTGKNKQPDMTIQLYNLVIDPGEKNDVADQHPEIIERIATIMKTARTRNPEFPIPALDR